MKFLPNARSLRWVWVLIVYTFVVYVMLFASQYFYKLQITPQAIASLGVLAFASALLACTGGWLGARVHFLFATAGALAGAIYSLLIVILDASPGWADLTSLAGFIILNVIGIAAGLIGELVWFFIKRSRRHP
jgi:hypothetical protein